ncbi:hypothetical protein [Paraburkholderia flava]|uniref:hypothetical protein n=1 Tax=Paraburkholderia flava TaxID=2547393 RepID=UPI0010610DFD|nr:hypothetical protein [Paraburkholderia flava]
MNQPTLLDVFGISLDEITAMQDLAFDKSLGEKANLSRLLTARRTQDSGAHIAKQILECRHILSKVGLYKFMSLMQELNSAKIGQPEWETVLKQIYNEPVAVRNRVIWLFFHACLQAECDFSLDVCPAHSREDVLTGRLLEGIKAACTSWAEASSSYLSRVQNVLGVSSIDLTIDGGEQKTGGDFALILDIEESVSCDADLEPEVIALTGRPRGDVFVPLLFQAKCYTGSRADISQKNSVRGYQFNQLRQANCASSYIFYENGKSRIDFPALPMVKSTSACKPIEVSRSTEVFDQSIDFATYILRAANGFESIPAAKTREDALNMILANTSPDALSRITILGNTNNLDRTYREALRQLRKEIDNEVDRESGDDIPDDMPSSRFEP